MATDYIGIVGLLLILAGWVWEFLQSMKSNKAGVPLSFALLYGAGSLMLTLHSIALGDIVFIILNAAAPDLAAGDGVPRIATFISAISFRRPRRTASISPENRNAAR